MEWLILLVCVFASVGITYLILRPKLIITQQQDEKIKLENEKMYEQNRILNEKKILLKQEEQELQNENSKLILQKNSAMEQIATLNNSISAIEKQAQEAADLFYQTKMKAATDNFEKSLEFEAQQYQENIQNFQKHYQETVNELMEQYKILEKNVSQLRSINDAAVEASKRAEAMKNQKDYYRIQLSAADIQEIELLRQVEPHLRNKEPLNKVIWKCYYEKPTNDLIGRVIGTGNKVGIYKITEIETNKCYVGQSNQLADRWKQHIKRGLGAETPTRNKLYPAMNAVGPENFTFEVIEECERSKLDEREDYWQEYFKAKEFGYSIR